MMEEKTLFTYCIIYPCSHFPKMVLSEATVLPALKNGTGNIYMGTSEASAAMIMRNFPPQKQKSSFECFQSNFRTPGPE